MAGIAKRGSWGIGQLLEWLNAQPKSTITDYSTVIAHRAALRALPMAGRIWIAVSDDRWLAHDLTAAVFRVHAVSWVALTIPTRGKGRATAYATYAADAADVAARVAAASTANATAAAVAASRVAYAAAAYAAEAAHFAASVVYSAAAYPDVSYADAAADAAARAAFATAPYSADTSIWAATTADARALEAGVSPAELAGRPLWTGDAPEWWERERQALDRALATAPSSDPERYPETNWPIWSEWYRSRVFGTPSFGLPREIAVEIDRRIALGDGRKDFWDRAPEEINGEIARWVAEARRGANDFSRPELPEQRAAPIETRVENGKVEVRPPAVSARSRGVLATHSILRSEAKSLATRLRGQMPDAADLMDYCHEELGDDASRPNIYAVGYYWQPLNKIGARVDESVMEDAAGRYEGFIINLQQYLQQFDEWIEYTKSPDLLALSKSSAQSTAAAGSEVADEYSASPEIVSEGVISRLDQLKLALGDSHLVNPETLYGFTVSIANVSVSISSIALEAFETSTAAAKAEIRAFFGAFGPSLRSEGPKLAAKATWTAAGTGAIAVLGGVASQLVGLSVAHPYLFGWVPSVLRYFGMPI